jgi:hypothetical protein
VGSSIQHGRKRRSRAPTGRNEGLGKVRTWEWRESLQARPTPTAVGFVHVAVHEPAAKDTPFPGLVLLKRPLRMQLLVTPNSKSPHVLVRSAENDAGGERQRPPPWQGQSWWRT